MLAKDVIKEKLLLMADKVLKTAYEYIYGLGQDSEEALEKISAFIERVNGTESRRLKDEIRRLANRLEEKEVRQCTGMCAKKIIRLLSLTKLEVDLDAGAFEEMLYMLFNAKTREELEMKLSLVGLNYALSSAKEGNKRFQFSAELPENPRTGEGCCKKCNEK